MPPPIRRHWNDDAYLSFLAEAQIGADFLRGLADGGHEYGLWV